MKTSSVTLYSTGYRETRTYLAAALFAAGNIVLPQLCHLVQLGGPTMLPIYFFTLVGAYKYGWRTGLLTALASPLVNAALFGMPAVTCGSIWAPDGSGRCWPERQGMRPGVSTACRWRCSPPSCCSTRSSDRPGNGP